MGFVFIIIIQGFKYFMCLVFHLVCNERLLHFVEQILKVLAVPVLVWCKICLEWKEDNFSIMYENHNPFDLSLNLIWLLSTVLLFHKIWYLLLVKIFLDVVNWQNNWIVYLTVSNLLTIYYIKFLMFCYFSDECSIESQTILRLSIVRKICIREDSF